MKRLSEGSVLLATWSLAGLGLLVGSGASNAFEPASPDIGLGATHATEPVSAPSPTPPSPALTAVVQQYCVVCHNDALLTGNLSLQHFAVESATEERETAEKMIRKLRAGMMPPPGIPRPSADTLLSLVETLESSVDEIARALPNLGTRRFQRLSRPEYERVIHELLGLEVNADSWLPEDLLVGSFDNMSAAQGLSTTLSGLIPEGGHRRQPSRHRKPAGLVLHHQAPQPPRGVAARLGTGRGSALRHPRRHGGDARLPRGRRVRLPGGNGVRQRQPGRRRGHRHLHRRGTGCAAQPRVQRRAHGARHRDRTDLRAGRPAQGLGCLRQRHRGTLRGPLQPGRVVGRGDGGRQLRGDRPYAPEGVARSPARPTSPAWERPRAGSGSSPAVHPPPGKLVRARSRSSRGSPRAPIAGRLRPTTSPT